jgi:hypothetical protein
MLKITLTLAVTGTMFVLTGLQDATAQVVTTYYAPAPAVSLVPVRRGLLGLRTGYAPVVTGIVPVPVTSYYAPVVEPAWSQSVTSYYAPPAAVPYAVSPVQTVTPVTLYYAPAPVPVTTYYGYGYAPPVYYRR